MSKCCGLLCVLSVLWSVLWSKCRFKFYKFQCKFSGQSSSIRFNMQHGVPAPHVPNTQQTSYVVPVPHVPHHLLPAREDVTFQPILGPPQPVPLHPFSPGLSISVAQIQVHIYFGLHHFLLLRAVCITNALFSKLLPNFFMPRLTIFSL